MRTRAALGHSSLCGDRAVHALKIMRPAVGHQLPASIIGVPPILLPPRKRAGMAKAPHGTLRPRRGDDLSRGKRIL